MTDKQERRGSLGGLQPGTATLRLACTACTKPGSLLPLEKLGLVSRQSDPRNTRVGYAPLTEAGKQLLDYALVSVQPIAADATRLVPAAQMGVLSTVLGQLAGMHLSH